MTARASILVLAAAVALALGACDSGPSGPGTVEARVGGGDPPAGAAVVELTGRGVRGFEPVGGTRVYSGVLSEASEATTYRVVLVNSGDEALRFGIRVDDRGGDLPTGVVVFAADTANRIIGAPGELDFGIER